MTKLEKEAIYRRAIDEYGPEVQTFKACEECGELIRALSRAEITGELDNLIEEIADVEVVIEQQMLISRSDIEHVKEEKIKRLYRRLSGNHS